MGDLSKKSMNPISTIDREERTDVLESSELQHTGEDGIGVSFLVESVEVDVPEDPSKALGKRRHDT